MSLLGLKKRSLIRGGLLAIALGVASVVNAANYTISVSAGGTDESNIYRVKAIQMAADILMDQAKAKGQALTIKVDTHIDPQWDSFKQAFTLAAQAGKAPDIVVTGHEDIAPWAQAGYIAPIENYVSFDRWPLSAIYPNLIKIASFNGMVYGVPEDSESRPFFFWIPYLKKIGYTDAQIAALPQAVASGKYTLYDMLKDAKKIQDMGLVKKGYGFYPRVSNGPDYWQFYVSFGGEIQEPKTGRLVFDKEAMQKTYQFFADAVKMGVTRRNHIGTPWDQWYSEVAHGKAAFWDGGTWHYARYKKEGLKDFFSKIQFTLIPKGETGVPGHANTLTHPLVYLLPKHTDQAKMSIAAQLIAIASEPRINALHAINSSHLGISKIETEIPFYANDRWTAEATKRLLPYAFAMPNNTSFAAYWNIYWKGLEATWTGQKTAQQAVADDVKEIRATLANQVIIR